MKKMFTLALLTFAVVCFGALPALATSLPTHTQSVTIHKLSLAPSVFNDPQYPKAHDGSQLDLAATFGAGNATELNGVTFTYFRVDQNATLNAMTDDQLKALTPAQLQAAPYSLTAQTITTDGSDGATLAALADGRYVFYETAYSGTGTIANQKAVPFVLTLPVTNAAGTGYVDPIHIYPKNLVENPPSVDKDVTAIGTDADTFDIGATQTWLITTDIPEGIATSTEYIVTDNLSKGLTYTGNLTLAYAQGGDFNLTLGTDYTVSVPADGTAAPTSFSVTFTAAGRAKLDPAKDLRITFTSVINKDAVMGVTIPNNVQLNYTNANGYNYGGAITPENDGNTATNSPTVVTGGKQFKKTDAAAAPLAGAQFIVSRLNGTTTEYMVQDPTTLAVTWTTTKTAATTFTSAATTGLIDIKGLDYGSYKLTEILAPTGYALLGAPIDFTVDATSYNTVSPTQITNNLNPSIPATGGIGSLIFVLVGLAIMGVAVFGLKKRADHKA